MRAALRLLRRDARGERCLFMRIIPATATPACRRPLRRHCHTAAIRLHASLYLTSLLLDMSPLISMPLMLRRHRRCRRLIAVTARHVLRCALLTLRCCCLLICLIRYAAMLDFRAAAASVICRCAAMLIFCAAADADAFASAPRAPFCRHYAIICYIA